MAQEENTQKCSNSSSGGVGGGGGGGSSSGGCGGSYRSSKKLKQKKVPQRGLGVAQLEKIRLEEQQKKDHAARILSPKSIISSSNSSSCSAVHCPNFGPIISSPSSIPLPPPSPTDLLPSPSCSLFRAPPPSIPNADALHPSPIPGRSCWPKLWGNGGECNLDGGNSNKSKHHYQGFAFSANVNLPYDSSTSPVWPHSGLIQRSQQPSSSSVVSASSAALNFHTEPPSNQSSCSNNNNFTPLWPQEDKIGGMKRTYPFSLDNPPVPSFLRKFPPSCIGPISRLDEPSSCSNGGTFYHEPIKAVSREGLIGSEAVCESSSSKKVYEGNGSLAGDFLTLAPPASALPQLSSKSKHLSGFRGPQNQELSEFEAMPFQGKSRISNGNNGNPNNHWAGGGEESMRQQPFLFSFFPSSRIQVGLDEPAAAATPVCNNGGKEDAVDLNLKL